MSKFFIVATLKLETLEVGKQPLRERAEGGILKWECYSVSKKSGLFYTSRGYLFMVSSSRILIGR